MARVTLAVLAIVLAVLAWGAWQVVQGGQALQRGAAQLQDARSGLTSGEELLPRLASAAEDTSSAREHLDDPVVRLLGATPGLGRPVDSARAVAQSADRAVTDALLPLAEAAGADPAQRLFHDGALDITYLDGLSGPAALAAESLREAAFMLEQAPKRSGVGQVDAARTQLANGIAELRSVVEQLSTGTRIAPALLGVDAPQRYLLVAQNPAEARGTGGLVGGYVLIEVEAGILRAVDTGSNRDLEAFGRGHSVVDLGEEFTEHWGGFLPTGAWVNSNVSPHFPYAATIWHELWEQQTGQSLAGILTLDPIALSYLMRSTGPLTLSDGTRATADNVVELTLRDTYQRFDQRDQTARKEYLQEISRGVFGAVSTGSPDPRQLLDAVTKATRESRLQFWAADPAVQEELADTAVVGRLPEGQAAIGDVINDVSGSKLAFYLDRTLSYSPGCDRGPSSLALTLRNNAPTSGLPDYVNPTIYRDGTPAGTHQMLVTVYLPPQSQVLEARLGEEVVLPRQGTELGLTWIEQLVTLEPQTSITLRLSFAERFGASPQVERVHQALVREERFTVTGC